MEDGVREDDDVVAFLFVSLRLVRRVFFGFLGDEGGDGDDLAEDGTM